MVKPISPNEVCKKLPEFVIESVNELIQEKYQEKNFYILKKDIISRIELKKAAQIAFDFEWLNFESLYKKFGWKVVYVPPDYTEDFDAYFVFSS